MDALYYLFVVVVVIGGLAQAALIPHMRIAGVFPDFMLVLVVSWSILRGAREGVILALMAGLVLDLFSGAPFGLFTISYVCASLLAGLGASTGIQSRLAITLLAVALSTLCYYTIGLLMQYMAGQSVLWLETFTRVVLPGMALNLGTTVIVFPLASWLHRKTLLREREW